MQTIWKKENLDLQKFRVWDCALPLNSLEILVDFLISQKNLIVVEFIKIAYPKIVLKQIPRLAQHVKVNHSKILNERI
jgi:hypothetical protein